ncbi:MAG: T9SS type A sorting domain-containing protein [Ignavibacteria bacterium]|nr:T9SS type A sorting domain-containing protein [Ignavibacteria bacterium]
MKKHLLVVIALVALVGITFSQAQKTVLFENWTSSTCGPCASNNPQLKVWIQNNWNALICVSYHVGWPSPGNDPMYLHNPTESYDRRYYYSINSVPAAKMEGLYSYVGSPFNFSSMTGNYNYYTGLSANTAVTVTDTRVGDSIRAVVNVTKFSELPAGTYTLRVMAVERWVIYTSPPGTNGETVFGNVFRKSLPSATGTPITITPGTESYTFTYYKNPVWQDSSMYTLAFLQNDNDKSVVNSGRMGMLVGVEPFINETPERFTLQQNYPNPFNPTTNIKFSMPENGYASLKVFNVLGKEVKTLVDGNQQKGTYNVFFDASNLPSGIYFYTLNTGKFTETKKMILVK